MQLYLSRQPILDARREVVGYELLHRAGPDNAFDGTDGDVATAQIIERAVLGPTFGKITRDKPAFINFPRRLLVSGLHEILPPEVVVEILEDVDADVEILRACRELKDHGVSIALDDFEDREGTRALIEFADVIKVDFTGTSAPKRELLAQRYGGKCRMLAEKVETWDDFEEAQNLGYHLFQGFYFCEPQQLTGDSLPGSKLAKLRFIRAVSHAGIDYEEVERIVRSDTSLTIKMLRFLNSAAVGTRQKIDSVRQALIVLGERRLRRWGTLVAISGLAEEQPIELLITALTRARFAELIGTQARTGLSEVELFLLGMLSIVDALVEVDLASALEVLDLVETVRAPLLGDRDSAAGRLLMLLFAYERGEWDAVEQLGSDLDLDAGKLADGYTAAVQWADEVTAEV